MLQGKIVNYLKYSIGEILLIVIGILIALQINNWNEAQKRNRLLQQYKSNLKTELWADINTLDSLTNFRKECKESVFQYIDYYNKEHPNIDTLIMKKDTLRGVATIFNKTSYTLQQLSETGNISLFNNEEKQAIVKLKNIQDKYQILEKELFDVAFKCYMEFSNNTDALFELEQTTKEHKEVSNWRFDHDATQYRLYNNYLANLILLYNFQDSTMYPELYKSTRELLTLLNQEE